MGPERDLSRAANISWNVGWREPAFADFQQRADNFSDHVAQKRTAADYVGDLLAIRFVHNFRRMNQPLHVAIFVIFFRP